MVIGGITFLVALDSIVGRCLRGKDKSAVRDAIKPHIQKIGELSNNMNANIENLFEQLVNVCACVVKLNNKDKKIDNDDARKKGSTLWRCGFTSSILGLVSDYPKFNSGQDIDFLGIYCCLRVLQMPILVDGIWTTDFRKSIKISDETRSKALALFIGYLRPKLDKKKGSLEQKLSEVFKPENSNALEKIMLYDFGMGNIREKLS